MYTEKRSTDTLPPAVPPLTRVVGGRGVGKTAPLKDLQRHYQDRIPLAYHDLAGRALTNSPSPVTAVLCDLSHYLGIRTRHHTLDFLRFELGLLAAVRWRPDGADAFTDLNRAEAGFREAVLNAAMDRNTFGRELRDWLDEVDRQLPDVAVTAPVTSMLRIALGVARRRLAKPRMGGEVRKALLWWEKELSDRPGHLEQPLFHFILEQPLSTTVPPEVEESLMAAFFADISEHYNVSALALRPQSRPLILLDNVHTTLGKRFMATLESQYEPGAGRQAAGARATRPVVVATELGSAIGLPQVRDRALKSRRNPTGQPPGPAAPSGAAQSLRLSAPALTRSHVSSMFPSAGGPGEDVLQAIPGLCSGRAGSVCILVAAVRKELDAGRPVSAVGLLGLPGVRQQLLDHLVPDDGTRLRKDLALTSIALDLKAAGRVLDRPWTPGSRINDRVEAVHAFAHQEHWQHGPGWPADGREPYEGFPGGAERMPFVQDRTLRTLLLDILRSEQGSTGWLTLHRKAAAGYVLRSPAPQPADTAPQLADTAPHSSIRALHHRVALGGVAAAQQWLHGYFLEATGAAWLDALQLICAAPPPPVGFDPPREDPADCPWDPAACPWCHDRDDQIVHDALTRLMAELRLVTPFGQAFAASRDRVTRGLTDLRAWKPGDRAYDSAVQVWPAELGQGVRVPDLTVRTADTAGHERAVQGGES